MGSVEITGPLSPLLIKIHFSQLTSSLSGKSSRIWTKARLLPR
jgi:hypothetical protein